MRLPKLDSALEKYTDVTWSVARAIGFADVVLRSGEGWLYNVPKTPAECAMAPSPSPCAPRRNAMDDVYDGFAIYVATAMGIGCISVMLSSALRRPDNLSYRAAEWHGRERRPARRGVLTLPRDELGWAANSFRAAVLCVGHAIVTYNSNQTVRSSHGFRLGVGNLAGAGLVLLYTGAHARPPPRFWQTSIISVEPPRFPRAP